MNATTESLTILAELQQIRDLLTKRVERQEPILVDTAEAARVLGVCDRTLLRWVSAGKIRRFKEDGVFRFRMEDLKAFAEERSVKVEGS